VDTATQTANDPGEVSPGDSQEPAEPTETSNEPGRLRRGQAKRRGTTPNRVRLGIRTKLIASFAVVLALGGFVGWIGLTEAGKINAGANELYSADMVGMGNIARLARQTLADHADVLRAATAPGQKSQAGIRLEIRGYDQEVSATLLLVMNGDPDDVGVQRTTAQFQRAWNEYRQLRDDTVLAAIDDGRVAEAVAAINGPLEDRAIGVVNSIDQIIAAQLSAGREANQLGKTTYEQSRRLILGITLVAILVGLAIALALSRQLARNVGSVSRAAHGVAAGDLAQRARVRGRDEVALMASSFNTMAEQLQGTVEKERQAKEELEAAVGEYVAFAERAAHGDLSVRLETSGNLDLRTLAINLNGMAGSLGELSGQVRSSAEGIGGATTEILAAVNQHTASISEQSAALTETSATMEEVRTAAEHTSRKARDVAEQASNSVQVSEEGSQAVEAIAGSMQDIREKVEGIARDILALSEQTQAIGEITATVNDLADQSNLLALNASIEAAKAGEQGKGFAVVAGEIRNLAEQTKQATTQVRTILGDIQKAANTAVLATEQGTRVVEQGMGLAQRAGEVIGQLADTIRGAAQAAQQIAASAHEQSVGMDQIAQAMTDVNEATTQFVTWAEQTQVAAESLNELSRQLQAMTESYKV
jgi:methyl-accepting chemotaxis protein